MEKARLHLRGFVDYVCRGFASSCPNPTSIQHLISNSNSLCQRFRNPKQTSVNIICTNCTSVHMFLARCKINNTYHELSASRLAPQWIRNRNAERPLCAPRTSSTDRWAMYFLTPSQWLICVAGKLTGNIVYVANIDLGVCCTVRWSSARASTSQAIPTCHSYVCLTTISHRQLIRVIMQYSF